MMLKSEEFGKFLYERSKKGLISEEDTELSNIYSGGKKVQEIIDALKAVFIATAGDKDKTIEYLSFFTPDKTARELNFIKRLIYRKKDTQFIESLFKALQDYKGAKDENDYYDIFTKLVDSYASLNDMIEISKACAGKTNDELKVVATTYTSISTIGMVFKTDVSNVISEFLKDVKNTESPDLGNLSRTYISKAVSLVKNENMEVQNVRL